MAVYTYADEAARKQAAKVPLNNGKVRPAPVTQVKPTVAKTAVKPAPIAPINNSATNTVSPAPTLGYGQGGEYGKTPGLGSAYSANKALISTDAGRNSEITRSQGVISELQKALQADPNNADLQNRLAGANKYLTVNLGYKPGEVGISGSFVGSDQGYGADPGYGANEYQNEVDTQLAAYQGELDSAKLATQFGIDTNQNYLNESLDQLKGAEAVALDQAQQTQNRFGGLYSGGLGYQSGAINSSYANQRGGLTRDVAGRNQQLLDQYGSQAKTIATQIQQLKSASPGIIRDKIAEFKLKQDESKRADAALTGSYNGERTLAGQQLDYAKQTDQRDFDFQKSTTEWNQAFQQGQFNWQKAQQVWENAFKDKSFAQSVKDAAASRGLQWANLNQSQQHFIADQAFREKQFEYQKSQDASSQNSDMKSELDGLYSGLTSGQLRPDSAIAEIDGREKMGFITSADATKMRSFVQKYLEGGNSTPKPQAVDNSLLNMSNAQLLEAWKTDPSGKAAGRSQYDWRSWVTDPNGYKSGTSYELWKSKYGPTLGG